MGVFNGQGKSGVTGSDVETTVNKNKNTGGVNESLRSYAQKPKGGSGTMGDMDAPMVGSPNIRPGAFPATV